jgi:hypothetical protein
MGERAQSLDREGFLQRAVIREVSLPGGSIVCIRALPASALVSGADGEADAFAPANLLIKSLCDENGRLLFKEGEGDVVMSVDHMALKSILNAILDLNGLATAQEGSDLGKNF